MSVGPTEGLLLVPPALLLTDGQDQINPHSWDRRMSSLPKLGSSKDFYARLTRGIQYLGMLIHAIPLAESQVEGGKNEETTLPLRKVLQPTRETL